MKRFLAVTALVLSAIPATSFAQTSVVASDSGLPYVQAHCELLNTGSRSEAAFQKDLTNFEASRRAGIDLNSVSLGDCEASGLI